MAPYSFDPLAVGADIGQYYTTALAAQPGYTDILRNISGVLSPQAKYEIGQAAAERGIGIGSYGGANDASGLLRALGLSSQALTDKGIEQYGKAYSAVPAVNPATLYLSPQQREAMRLEWEMQQAKIAADEAAQGRSIASAEKLARMNQQTQFGVTGWNINAAKEAFDINRADTLAFNKSVTGQLAGLASRLSGGGGGAPGASSPWGTAPAEAAPEALPEYWRMPISSGGGAGGQPYNPETTTGPAYADWTLPSFYDTSTDYDQMWYEQEG